MACLQRVPKINLNRFYLPEVFNLKEDVNLKKLSKKCFDGKPHLINANYWHKNPEDICCCSVPGCDFNFKKGHQPLLERGTIEILRK